METASSSSSSSSSTSTSSPLVNLTAKLLEGEKLNEKGDYENAATLLSETLEEAVQRYGEFGDECGPIYYQYGCALLGQAQKERGLLGDQLEKKAAVKSEENAENDSKEPKTEGEGEGGENTGKESEKEENDDLKLAWDVLEVARIIYEKKIQGESDINKKKENQLFLATIHAKIGDLSMETENFDQSYEDHKKALHLKQEVLSEDDRSLAATLSTLAVICLYQVKNLQALEYYKQASETFRKRLLTYPNKLSTLASGPSSSVQEVFQTFGSLEKLLSDYKESKSFYDELLERVEDLEQVIKKEEEEKLLPKTEEKKPSFGQTTIGFGNSSSSSSGEASTDKNEVVQTVPVLSVKRKRDKAPSTGNSLDEGSKRLKETSE